MAGAKRTPGRKRASEWDEVIINDEGTVACRKCQAVIHDQGRKHVETVRVHLKKKCPMRFTDPKISELFLKALPPNTLRAFHEKLADWFYTSGIPMSKVEDPKLLQALQVLHPQVSVPNRKQLSTTLLDTAYERQMFKIESSLRGKAATLVTDGWTDINGRSVINYVATLRFFLESVYGTDERHTAEYIANDIERVFEKYNFVQWCGVVTDNTTTNQSAWKLLRKKHPKMFFNGCVCHTIHLLVKDLLAQMKWLSELDKKSRDLVVLFNSSHRLNYHLGCAQADAGVKALALPVATRWGSLLKCFRTILDSEKQLNALVNERDFMDVPKKQRPRRKTVVEFVRNVSFVPSLQKAVDLLSIICDFMHKFERNTTPPSEVYSYFVNLKEKVQETKLSSAEKKVVCKLVDERFAFVYEDAHGLGFYLIQGFWESVWIPLITILIWLRNILPTGTVPTSPRASLLNCGGTRRKYST
jgi:hypothetical protein